MGNLLLFLLIVVIVSSGNCHNWKKNANKQYSKITTRTQCNVNNQTFSVCSTDPMTGWYRNGKCMTDSADRGTHVVCAVMTDEFLDYTKSKGNDLSTQRGSFPGLKAGVFGEYPWCLCEIKWGEAQEADIPPLVDGVTHKKVLENVDEGVLLLKMFHMLKIKMLVWFLLVLLKKRLKLHLEKKD